MNNNNTIYFILALIVSFLLSIAFSSHSNSGIPTLYSGQTTAYMIGYTIGVFISIFFSSMLLAAFINLILNTMRRILGKSTKIFSYIPVWLFLIFWFFVVLQERGQIFA